MDFLEPSYPFIIVRKLTMEVIEKVIHAHIEDDAYWLKKCYKKVPTLLNPVSR